MNKHMNSINEKNIDRNFFRGLAIGTLVMVTFVGASMSRASFADNTLIRNDDGETFVIKGGEREKIESLEELRREHLGKKIIDVDDKTIERFGLRSEDDGDRDPNDNTLMRGQDRRVFFIKDGQRRHIRNLEELQRNFQGKEILNIDSTIINTFPVFTGTRVVKTFAKGTLVRNSGGQIFTVEDNGLRRVATMNELRSKHAGEDIHFIGDDSVRVSTGVKLRGDGTIDDDFAGARRASARSFDDRVNGVKLRGDGSVDDNGVSGRSGISDDFVGGVKLRGDGSVDDNGISGRDGSSDDFVGGVKLRGDGSIDDNGASSRSGVSDDFVGGVKLRGDGSIDDNSSGVSSSAGGVNLRGDGSVDDNGVSGRNSSSDDSIGDDSGSGRNGGADDPAGDDSGRGRGSDD